MKFATGAALLLLATGLAACNDPETAKKANEDARAAAKAKQEARRVQERLDRRVHCLSGLRWQQAALARAGIGPVKLYEDYYRAALAKDLGDTVLPAEGARPELSAAKLDAYLAWAYPEHVRTVLTAGKDSDKDGTVSPSEASMPGRSLVAGCVLEVAEMGQGPLAGEDKVARMWKMQDLGKALTDTGA